MLQAAVKLPAFEAFGTTLLMLRKDVAPRDRAAVEGHCCSMIAMRYMLYVKKLFAMFVQQHSKQGSRFPYKACLADLMLVQSVGLLIPLQSVGYQLLPRFVSSLLCSPACTQTKVCCCCEPNTKPGSCSNS